ncbi:uncharacterized protein [Battus philenor]|uniref:uncharacterized protein n=1 Tax=Battus philenor TaxID=42288 RepID=UPI0035CF1120
MNNYWLYVLLFCFKCCLCTSQMGPDPWDYKINQLPQELTNDIPPDLRSIPKKTLNLEKNTGMNEWFFKRILAIVLKGGQIKENEDDTIDISLQMKFDREQWTLLNQYLTSSKFLTDDIFRRIIGYIEESIYKPSITEKVVMAWNEYIQTYLIEYKVQITWILSVVTFKLALFWLMKRMSSKHLIIMSLVLLYIYEVFISYKEAEQKDLERFLAAVNSCKWYFWSSNCEVPPPDLIIFLKHMNPLKIGIRMFTTLISEPIITFSETMKIITHGITDGLWFPLDKIMYVLLIVFFNTLFIMLLIMIFYNYLRNMPFNINFLGLISVGVKQKEPQITTSQEHTRIDNNDKLSGPVLEKLLDVCSQALSTSRISQKDNNKLPITATRKSNFHRSASTGRLCSLDYDSHLNNNMLIPEISFSNNHLRKRLNGGGDA